jgi:hypothetical protein
LLKQSQSDSNHWEVNLEDFVWKKSDQFTDTLSLREPKENLITIWSKEAQTENEKKQSGRSKRVIQAQRDELGPQGVVGIVLSKNNFRWLDWGLQVRITH